MSLVAQYGIKPKYWVYRISGKELEEIFKDILLKKMSLFTKINLYIEKDYESDICYLNFCEDWLSSLSDKQEHYFLNNLFPRMNSDDSYENFNIMLSKIFDFKDKYEYGIQDYDEKTGHFDVEVFVPLSDISRVFI